MKELQIGNLVAHYPIVQGGMGVGISLWSLASAVANQGGIGVISSAGLGMLHKNDNPIYTEASIYGLRQEIRKAKANTQGIIGVNIMVALTNYADMVRTAIEEKADIIFSGAGLPLNLPSYLEQENKTKLVPIVSSARATRIICSNWNSKYNYYPDAIVLEGPKAGGHLGYKLNQINNPEYSIEHNLPLILQELDSWKQKAGRDIPLIVGGGIYTGEDIYNIIKAGASAVQMGTRFVTTQECDASEEFKNSYIKATKEDIAIIESPVGMPGRAINNSFLEGVAKGEKHPKNCVCHCIKTCDSVNSPYCIMLALLNAYKGIVNDGFCFAGSNAYRATKITTVRALFEELIAEYNACNQANA